MTEVFHYCWALVSSSLLQSVISSYLDPKLTEAEITEALRSHSLPALYTKSYGEQPVEDYRRYVRSPTTTGTNR
jgi:hypothetical protein